MNVPARSRLQSMRRRLTLVLASVAAIGLGVLALLATLIDSNLRADEADTHRQGLASRLAAYIYPEDDTGLWNVDGVLDDAASTTADAVAVIDDDGQFLYASADITGYEALLAAGIADYDEVGAAGTFVVDGETQQAAAAPYWDFDEVVGVVLVSADREAVEHNRLRTLVWVAAAALTALSAAAAWIVAGRVVKPLAEALEREERFLATAAHDIRTPMSKVRALSESALRTSRKLPPGAETNELRRELRRLVSVASDAADSANDLLIAGRIDAEQFELRMETVSLDQLVAGFEATIPNLAVETHEPVAVFGDPLMLKHAVANILSNAQHHGQTNGGDTLIEASVDQDGDEAVVVIADRGPGLGGRNPATLFDRYSGLAEKRTGGGGGLGLWIVQSVIAEHEGSVRAYDRESGGAAFEIRLPRHTAD